MMTREKKKQTKTTTRSVSYPEGTPKHPKTLKEGRIERGRKF